MMSYNKWYAFWYVQHKHLTRPILSKTQPTSCITAPFRPYRDICKDMGLYSLSGKTSYRKISWSLEAARFGFQLFQSLWNLAGTSAALLSRCLSNFRAIRPLQHPISWLRDFTRFGGKTSYRLVNRGHGSWKIVIYVVTYYWSISKPNSNDFRPFWSPSSPSSSSLSS